MMAEPNLIQIEPSLVEKMSSSVPSHKPEVIQAHFGIGVKTWVKIRRGQAIRRSVAVRLVDRLQRQGAL